MSLSSLLVQREVATIRDVEEALARQVLYGGDLVTNLLECATVDEAKLVDVLGESMNLRPAGAGPLPSDEQARSLVPRDVADKRSILPLCLTEDGEQLVLAVAEALSPADEEKLMFAFGIPLVQRAAPLVRIREALARDYGLVADRRFDRLARRLRGERVESMQPPAVRTKVREATPAPKATMSRSTIASFPAPQGVEAIVPRIEPTPQPMPVHHTLAREGPPPARPQRRRNRPLTFDGAKRELEAAQDRDGLLDLFFDFSRQYFDYAALFVVHGDLAEGRDAFGAGATRDRVAALGVPLDMPSVLSVAKERGVPVVSVPPNEGIDGIFLTDLGRPPKGEAIVVPLVVRRRTVALLYGDSNDTDAPVENPSDVTTFALLMGQAFERLIMKKKVGSSDRALSTVPQPTRDVRETSDEIRAHRAALLSRVVREGSVPPAAPPPPDEAPRSAPPPPAMPHETPPSPAATSVPPPPVDLSRRPESPTTRVGTDPPPENVLLVRKPVGPPIPREDPVDPTTRPPEQVFEPRRSQPPARPSGRPSAPPRRSAPPLPTRRTAPPMSPGAEPHVEVPDGLRAPKVPDLGREVDDAAATPMLGPVGDATVPEPEPSGPSRIEAEELTPQAAAKVLAELEGEEIDDDMIEESVPASLPPLSQTVVVAARRPPTARGVTEELPTIMVDVSAELEVLVKDIVAGRNEERASQELLRQGATAMPAIMASFPGPIRNELRGDEEFFPPFSTCGPVLRLVAAQRRVALPYVLPLVSQEREEVRFWAVFAITELAYPDLLPAVVPCLFDDSARVRKAARLATGAMARAHGEQVARDLGRFVRDAQNERRKRIEVIRLLEEIRDAFAVPTFIALLDDADREIYGAALHGLEVLARQELGGDPKKWKSWWNAHSSMHRIEWLIEALMHESLPLRKAASDELKAITKEYFGYYPDESKRDREKAQARYRDWWSTEGRLKFAVH